MGFALILLLDTFTEEEKPLTMEQAQEWKCVGRGAETSRGRVENSHIESKFPPGLVADGFCKAEAQHILFDKPLLGGGGSFVRWLEGSVKVRVREDRSITAKV